ncbi:sensor histidine kinase [Rathayibacter sp. CAU 1779]
MSRTGVAGVTTDATDPRTTEHPMRRTGFGIALNATGLAVVTIYLIQQWIVGVIPFWTLPVSAVAVLAWLVALALPTKWWGAIRVFLFITTASAAVVAWPTNGLLIIPVIVGILGISSPTTEAPWLGYAFAAVAAVLVATTPIVAAINGEAGVTIQGVLSIEFAVLIALLGGINRRQSRARQAAATALAERTATMREEQARASALAARQSLARDMHDVLAHSLGGLVIQLDAVEAQLEAGETAAALVRLHDARSMAASGLAEARRAVEALRSAPDAAPSVSSTDLAASLIDLVDAHERLGGRIDFEQRGTPHDVPDVLATALRRALQESLSNARKHAPDEQVTVRIDWTATRVGLTVSNAVPATIPTNPLATSGGGRGLAGMAERFDELPDGRVEAARDGDTFVVRATASLGAEPRAGAASAVGAEPGAAAGSAVGAERGER